MGNALNDDMDHPMREDNDDEEWNQEQVNCSLSNNKKACKKCVKVNGKRKYHKLECGKYCRDVQHEAVKTKETLEVATEQNVQLQGQVNRLQLELHGCQQNQQTTTQDFKYQMDKIQQQMRTKMWPDFTKWSGLERDVEALHQKRHTLQDDIEHLCKQYESTEDTWRLLFQQCNDLRVEIEMLRNKAKQHRDAPPPPHEQHRRSSEDSPPEWSSGDTPPEEKVFEDPPPDNLKQFMPPHLFSDRNDAATACVEWYANHLMELDENEVEAMHAAIKQCNDIKILYQLLCVDPHNPDAMCLAYHVLRKIMYKTHPDTCEKIPEQCRRLYLAVNEMWERLKAEPSSENCPQT